jgi:hypothetical protein
MMIKHGNISPADAERLCVIAFTQGQQVMFTELKKLLPNKELVNKGTFTFNNKTGEVLQHHEPYTDEEIERASSMY